MLAVTVCTFAFWPLAQFVVVTTQLSSVCDGHTPIPYSVLLLHEVAFALLQLEAIVNAFTGAAKAIAIRTITKTAISLFLQFFFIFSFLHVPILSDNVPNVSYLTIKRFLNQGNWKKLDWQYIVLKI